MNNPTSVRRVYTPAEQAIYNHIRQELAFWTAERRRYKRKFPMPDRYTTFRLCALHKALNRLRGRADCHVVKRPDCGYTDEQVQAMATRLMADAEADIGQPLRCYVVVSGHGLKHQTREPRTSQLHVQAAHALAEMMKYYHLYPQIRQWADVDKTLIVCQGFAPRGMLPIYAPYARWPESGFIDDHYGATPLAYALWPMTERCAKALELTDRALL